MAAGLAFPSRSDAPEPDEPRPEGSGVPQVRPEYSWTPEKTPPRSRLRWACRRLRRGIANPAQHAAPSIASLPDLARIVLPSVLGGELRRLERLRAGGGLDDVDQRLFGVNAFGGAEVSLRRQRQPVRFPDR